MQAKTVVLQASDCGGLAEWRGTVIQLYHGMDTLVTRLWRALTAPRDSVPVPPGGVRVLPAYAALARYHMSSIELDGRLRMFVSQIAAVTALVAAQHFFNPITGALGADVAPWGAPVGSSIRNLWL